MSKREDKRWTRERDREDERWRRDLQRERELKVFAERKSAYGQALIAASAWMGELIHWQNHLQLHDGPKPRHDRIDEHGRETRSALAIVQLVGHEDVAAAAHEVTAKLADYEWALESWQNYAEEVVESPNDLKESVQAMNECRRTLDVLRKAARTDIELLVPVSPSPPSVKTS